MRRPAVAAALALSGAGAACVAYGTFVEKDAFVLRRYQVPVLPDGARPLRVLHISDLHLRPSRRRERDWVAGLADLDPDLVVSTGDHWSTADALPELRYCLGGLLERPGVFVTSGNDYNSPVPKTPMSYFTGRPERDVPPMPVDELRALLGSGGWHDLTGARARLRVGELDVELRGTDDAHLHKDDYSLVAGPPDPEADLNVAVTHAPYLRLLDAMTADGCALLLAGHTHGGQVCVPGAGAIITNCDIDRPRVKGLSRHGDAWLHVSAGLGTSPFAPFRFACRPEASLLTLVPRGSMG